MGVAIELRFLAGRFHATPWGRHVNEAALEWPPSPWRLARAIVAGAARAGLDLTACRQVVRPFLELPRYWLPAASAAHTRHYMPWEKNRGKVEKVLVFDPFVVLSEPLVVAWPEEVQDRGLLSRILEAVGYLGRSQSWAEFRLVDAPPGEPNSVPLEAGRTLRHDEEEVVELLAPDPTHPGAFEALLATTDDVRGKGLERPPGTRWVRYRRPRIFVDPPRRPQPWRAAGPPPTTAVYVVRSTAPPPLTEALTVTELLRRSALAWYGRLNEGAASPVLSGKDALGQPLEGHRHAYYLAVDEDGDRRVDRLVVHAPMGFGRTEREALLAIRTLQPGRGRPPVHLHLAGLGLPQEFESRLFGSATRWRSHTPFLLVRHPRVRGQGQGRRITDDPVAQVLLELERRGLPRPLSVRPVRGPGFRWLEFRTHRRGDIGPPGAFGFALEFAEPVSGPIALGRLCHFGLGLFLPAPG